MSRYAAFNYQWLLLWDPGWGRTLQLLSDLMEVNSAGVAASDLFKYTIQQESSAHSPHQQIIMYACVNMQHEGKK